MQVALITVLGALFIAVPGPSPVAAVLGYNLASGADGATCSAINTWSGACTNVIDGSTTTGWAPYTRGLGTWVQVNLSGGAAPVSHFRVIQGGSNGSSSMATGFVIEYLDVSGAWVTHTTWSGSTADSGILPLTTPLVSAASWRIRSTAGIPVHVRWTVQMVELFVDDGTGDATGYNSTQAYTGQVYAPERTVTFAAGTYVGRTYDSYGTETDSLTDTLTEPATASASERRYINGSWRYLMTSGPWEGYWILEDGNVGANSGDPTVSGGRTVPVSIVWDGVGAGPGTITLYQTQSAAAPAINTAVSCGALIPSTEDGNYISKTCVLPSDGVWKFFTVGTGEAVPSTYDSTLTVDTVAPVTPTVTCSNCAAAPRAHQAAANGTIYVRTSGLIGTEDLTVTGTTSDPTPSAGIEGIGFDPLSSMTGWGSALSLPFIDDTSPYSETITYSSAAVSATQAIHAFDNAMNQSPPRTLTIEIDNAPPELTWVAPAGAAQSTSDSIWNVQWTEADAVGVASRSLQRQRAPIAEGACGTFANDGELSFPATNAYRSAIPLVGYCYRWVLTVADIVGNSAATTSSAVMPQTAFVTPAADTETLFFSDFTDPASHAGWPGTRTQEADGNWRLATSAGNNDGNTKYGPLLPAAAGELYRLSGRYTSSGMGAISSVGLCFYNAAGVALLCAADIDTQDIEFNVVRVALATAPTGTTHVSFRVYDRYTTTYHDDVRIERVDTEDTAVQVDDTMEIAWAEWSGGPAITARSLQRQVATAASYPGCAGASFANDGSAVLDQASPVTQSGLLTGSCYRWVLTLTDSTASRTYTSGVRYVVDHAFGLHAMPTSSVGEAVHVAAIIEDRAGQPSDTYVGTLTISSDDAGAVFPDGTSFAAEGPETQAGHTFRVVFSEPGEHSVFVRGPNAQKGEISVTVSASTLTADAPAEVFAGVPFPLTVTPLDASDSVARQYAAEVEFSSPDAGVAWGPRISGAVAAYQFECACEGGSVFHPALSAVGQQTITVTDAFGATDTVTVEVIPAPASQPSPVERIDVVQWRHGDTIDWYLTAKAGAAPFTLLYTTHSCDPASTNVGIRVDPAVDRYVEFSTTLDEGGICWDTWLNEKASHTLTIVDGQGHKWTAAPNARHLRFSSVTGASQFRMLDPGDPIASMDVVSRPAGTVFIDLPNDKDAVRGTMEIEFEALERTTITETYLGRVGISGGRFQPNSWTPRGVVPGTNLVSMPNFTHVCWVGPSFYGMNDGWIMYTTASGRSGAFANGGGVIDEPDTAPPSAAICTGEDGPLDGNASYLRKLLARLNPFNFTGVHRAIQRFLEADPVDPLTGSFTQPITDFDLGGLAPALRLERTYRSDRAEAFAAGEDNAGGIFGPGWGSNLNQRLVVDGDEVTLVAADLGYAVFVADGAGGFNAATPGEVTLTLVAGAYRLEEQGGAATEFDSSGRVTAFEVDSGLQLTITYDGAGHLATMTDAAGRTADIATDTAGRITRVDLPDGRYVAFSYDAAGHMSSSRDMAGTVLTFITDVRGRITEIRNADEDALLTNVYDGQGKVIEQRDAAGNATYFTYDTGTRVSHVIDPLGAVTTSRYSSQGQIITRVDAELGIWRWAHNTAGNPGFVTDAAGAQSWNIWEDDLLVSSTDPLGRDVKVEYDAEGNVTRTLDSEENEVVVAYDANGLPTTVTRNAAGGLEPPLQLAAFGYDANGMPTSFTGPGGIATSTTTFDTEGYPVSSTDPEGRVTTYEVDARGFVTAAVDPLGTATGGVPADHTSSFTYDEMGRVLTSTNAEGETTTFAYDLMGRLLTVTSPLGFVTSSEYDLDGRIVSTTVQLSATESATTSFEYDAGGNLAAVVDAESRRVEFEYDLAGRRTLHRDANGNEWTTEYDIAGRVVAESDPTGRATQYAYDLAGRLVSTTDPAGGETTFGYDDLDQLVSTTDPLGHTTTYGYDSLGRQITVTNAEAETTETAYDSAGRVSAVTDNAGHVTSFEYNDAGQLTKVIDAALGESVFTYDAAGRLITRTNARNASEHYAYDNVHRLIGVTDADGSTWTTVYDDDGRVSYTIDANGQRTDFVVDRAGRVLSIQPSGSTADITFAYDDTGRVASMSDGSGTTGYTYDPSGRLTSVTRGSRVVGYAYDAAGRIASVAYPDSGGSVNYAYDSAGRLQTLTDWNERTHTYAYDDASRLTSVAGPDALVRTHAYDDADRLTAVNYAQNSSSLLSLGYTYDAAGNVATYADDAGTTSFGYDALNRLIAADHPGDDDFTYAYDPAGNITELVGPSGTSTRTYSDGDRLLTEASTASHAEVITTDTATGGWTDSENLSASDDTYGTASPDPATTLSLEAGFDFAAIPAGALIDQVTVSVEWRSSLASAELTLGAQALLGGTPVGTETTETTNPSTDTTASFVVADVDRAELETLTVVVRATRAGGDPVTASLDVVSVEVTYALPLREFTYDANGSVLDDGAGTTYAHDALGRLTTVTSAGLAASYTLDGAGNRVAATIDGVTTSYDLDLRGLATVLSDGSRRFLPGMPAAGYEEGGAWVGGLTNAQGTLLGHVDAAGLVGDMAHYDAWGQPLDAAPVPEGAGYTGEWVDATGLVNLRFRAYDPSLQRFIGGDTIAGRPTQPTTWNRHAYGNANPLTYTDPSGHFGVAARSTNGAKMVNHLFGSARDLFIALTGRDAGGSHVSWVERARAIRCLAKRPCAGDKSVDVPGTDAEARGITIPIANASDRTGVIRIGIFIEMDEAGPPTAPGLGDDRVFNPGFQPHENRAYIEIDFDNNEVYVQVNPSCRLEDGCRSARRLGSWGNSDKWNRFHVSESADGDLSMKWDFVQATYNWELPFMGPGHPYGPSIDGSLEISSDWQLGDALTLQANAFPSYEGYYFQGTDFVPLFRCSEGSSAQLLLLQHTCGANGWE